MYICRFRLELQVKDPTDSTIFVLFDEVVEQVVQVKCGDLTSNLENVCIYLCLSKLIFSIYTWFIKKI
jgi:hypothetical protein